jgi:spore coat protein SA
MKVLIVSPGTLPVPAVKGGAVQTGIQQLMDENEKHQQVELEIFSYYDEKASKASGKYKCSKVHFVKHNNLQYYLIRGINKVLKMTKVNKRYNDKKKLTDGVNKHLKKVDFDHVIIKNDITFVNSLYKNARGKLILQIHNDYLNAETPEGEKIVSRCEKVFVNSSYIKSRVLTLPNIKERNVLVNKNCTDLNMFRQEKDMRKLNLYKKKYGINEKDVVILYSGRTVPEKGIKELIMAVQQIPTNHKFKLLIMGSEGFGKDTVNEYLKDLKKRAEKIKDKIVFTGFIPYTELPYIHALTDVAVVPSIWEEPAGRVVIEAQASGIPVVVSDAGGISDYISTASTIEVKRGEEFVNDLSEALLKLIKNKQLREKMGKAGYEFAEDFSADKYYMELQELLLDVKS